MAKSLASMVFLVSLVQGPAQDADRVITREWSYYPNANGIGTIPGGVHVWHAADGATDGHSYGTLRLDLPPRTLEWEMDFRVRFGALGEVPSRLELRAGGTKFLEVSADSVSAHIVAKLGGRDVYRASADDAWRAFRIVGSGSGIALWHQGKHVASEPLPGAPDLLVFGGVKGRVGRQTEAWLKLDSVLYKVASGPAPPSAQRVEIADTLRIELVSLRQSEIGADRGDVTERGWRWIATVRVRNESPSSVDAVDLPAVVVITEDYREFLLRPMRWDESQASYAPVSRGEVEVPASGGAEIGFVSVARSPLPSGRPARAEIRVGRASRPLPLPPP